MTSNRRSSGKPRILSSSRPLAASLTGTLGAMALLVASPAASHDAWSDGEPVPAWVKAQCCSKAHAHHIADSAVHASADGYRIDGYPYLIPYYNALPSPDGSTWLFYPTFADGTVGHPFCFFVGAKGS